MGKDTAPKGQDEGIQGKNTFSCLVTRLMLFVQELGESHCHLVQNHLTVKSIGHQNSNWHGQRKRVLDNPMHKPKASTHLLFHKQPVSCFNVWGHEAILYPGPVMRHWANINPHC